MTPEIEKLLKQKAELIEAGNALFDRAVYTTREYDGLHRLGSAAAHWLDTVSKNHL